MYKVATTRRHTRNVSVFGLPAMVGATLFCTTLHCNAAPWANAGDERTRHHLHILADSGKLSLPITTWPIMWNGIKQGLDSTKVEELNAVELWSYRYLRHQIENAMRSGASSIQLRGSSNSSSTLNSFSDDAREGSQVSFSSSFISEHFAGQLSANYFIDPVAIGDNANTRNFDGSYLAANWGNWVLGVGAIDRWWGPGWQGSMALSNNARPAPSIFLQRSDTSASNPNSALLGSWDITLFAGELDDNVQQENTKLGGARLTVKPSRHFEIGLSQTALWGGKAPLNESDETTPEEENYNLISFDWRLGGSIKGLHPALYQQYSQKDGDNTSASGTAKSQLIGFELGGLIAGASSRFAIEYQSTENDTLSVFDHNFYRSGYRFYGRSIATSIDTGSQASTLRGDHYLDIGHQISWQLGNAQLNNDNIALELPAGHLYGPEKIALQFAALTYKLPLSETMQLEVGGQYLSEALTFATDTISSGGFIQLNIEL